ncbi:MAG TPA: extracellular matrix/biofilm biosynthesis regulator RemA family protein [Chondromyces sp.]|nr:extracellular matrix/biofilm biosynthesis regulator RemA family protein [Chondromyces sp.]
MYVHLGEEVMVPVNEIIAIIDKSSLKLSEEAVYLSDYYQQSAKTADDSYKSVVITVNHIYLSPFSSGTLKKRIDDYYIQKPFL